MLMPTVFSSNIYIGTQNFFWISPLVGTSLEPLGDSTLWEEEININSKLNVNFLFYKAAKLCTTFLSSVLLFIIIIMDLDFVG